MNKFTDNRRNTQFLLELLAILAMTAIVVTLGAVQYRWADQISRTEQQRLQSGLETASRNFSQEFSYDFQQLCESFQLEMTGPAATLEPRLLMHYGTWSRNSATPNLVTSVHIWRADAALATHLATYDEDSQTFVDGVWPQRFAALHGFVQTEFSALPRGIPDREAFFRPWTMYEDTPALIHPLYKASSGSLADPAGFVILELSGDYLSKIFLPELVRRTFGAQPEFQIAVRSADAPYQVVYSSSPVSPDSFASPDGKIDLIHTVDEELRRREGPGLQPSRPGREWLLLAEHPSGSVESAVAALRRRNLAISFGLLAILAVGMILIFNLARRAGRVARQQMEFVAGVSHELCTPLAVINSAAENLMDGVIEGPAGIKEYGGMIRDQGRRLEHLVDEVLQFAAGRSERAAYELRPVEVGAMISQCLASAGAMLRDAGFDVEQECPANLPPVLTDSTAVAMCLENLISNVVKYAGANHWIRISAEAGGSARSPTEVRLSVQDHGIGIPSRDLPHIFEPFYRVESVREGQIRGVGLGLYLVRRAMEGVGGSVSVTSEIGKGSCFTLHFPVAAAERAQPAPRKVMEMTD